MSAELRGRVAVISAHLDDAVFSLGASIAAATRDGARIRIVTVFSGDVTSTRPPGTWDANSGFPSEGEAARTRAVEDDNACRIVGAEPMRLSYRDKQYEQDHDALSIRSAIEEAVKTFDLLLVPGYPLRHEDHDWVTRVLLDGERPSVARVGLYAEQPYATWTKEGPKPILNAEHAWTELDATPTDQLVKLRACRAYRSQIEQLGGLRTLFGVLSYEAKRGGESVAWLAT